MADGSVSALSSEQVYQRVDKLLQQYDPQPLDPAHASHTTQASSSTQLQPQPQSRPTSSKGDPKIKLLHNWNLVLLDPPGSSVFSLGVEGYPSLDEGVLAWHSSTIVERVKADTIKTKTGSTYVLVGNINKPGCIRRGISGAIVEAFKEGFPEDWKEEFDKFKLHVKRATTPKNTPTQQTRRTPPPPPPKNTSLTPEPSQRDTTPTSSQKDNAPSPSPKGPSTPPAPDDPPVSDATIAPPQTKPRPPSQTKPDRKPSTPTSRLSDYAKENPTRQVAYASGTKNLGRIAKKLTKTEPKD
eukprot:TRINITY_DN8051_c1_g1_i4.p2 TRINITY_DN8051_c1_g1~~TRINITY_DN8051_c1_g1_i4.p2  ORF type:complete len:335 (-),score=79.07 TRINITY_DN8051_c1_g1_i4:1436-2329(-)